MFKRVCLFGFWASVILLFSINFYLFSFGFLLCYYISTATATKKKSKMKGEGKKLLPGNEVENIVIESLLISEKEIIYE